MIDSVTRPERQAHTVYLTAEVWQALSRRHLELRLQGVAPDSKIEFIEQVLRSGLEIVGEKASTFADEARMGRAAEVDDSQSVKQPGGPTKLSRGRGRDAAGPSARQPPSAGGNKVMDRLIQASDPGRPTPIDSAAGGAPSA